MEYDNQPLGAGEVLALADGDGFLTNIRTSTHSLVADEPESAGGTGAGPNPYDLLLASLGACKVMTLKVYADRKGWPLEGSQVRMRHHKVHAVDCAECESESGLVDRIDVALRLFGPLTNEQRQRLAYIADRCPVQRTITTETRILTSSVE